MSIASHSKQSLYFLQQMGITVWKLNETHAPLEQQTFSQTQVEHLKSLPKTQSNESVEKPQLWLIFEKEAYYVSPEQHTLIQNIAKAMSLPVDAEIAKLSYEQLFSQLASVQLTSATWFWFVALPDSISHELKLQIQAQVNKAKWVSSCALDELEHSKLEKAALWQQIKQNLN